MTHLLSSKTRTTLASFREFLRGAYTAATEPASLTAEKVFYKKPEPLHLPSDGIFGKFDRQQLQRGFQVYKEVCAGCHSLSLVSFRDLHQLGYNEAEVKAMCEKLIANTVIENYDIELA